MQIPWVESSSLLSLRPSHERFDCRVSDDSANNDLISSLFYHRYRVSTSYVTVEPKRRRHPSQPKELEGESSQTQSQSTAESIASGSPQLAPATPASDSKPPTEPSLQVQSEESHSSPSEGTPPASRQSAGRSAGRELRRARIVITVRRTASYKRWLEENPLQAIFAREGDADTALEEAPGPPKQPE